MANYPSDLEIANAANKKPIKEIAKLLDIDEKDLIKFGDDKAKLNSNFLNSVLKKENGKLILVSNRRFFNIIKSFINSSF